MALTFRDVKGAPLTSAEVDENFRTLQDAIDAFVSADGVGIASITVIGNQMTVHMTDATTQGPFPLPVAAFTWREEFVGGTEYDAYDVFTVSDSGVYLVLQDYTAATEFDPFVSNTNGPILSLMFGEVPIPKIPIVTVSGASKTPTPAEAGSYFRMTNASGADFIITDLAWDVGDVMTIRRVMGQVDIVAGDTDVSILLPSDCLPILRTAGSTGTLIYAGGGVWDLSGDLAQSGAATTTDVGLTTTGP